MKVEIKTEVAGTIWTIDVNQGDEIVAGSSVVTVESMKMEIPVEVSTGGVVTELLVVRGEAVEEGQVVATLTVT